MIDFTDLILVAIENASPMVQADDTWELITPENLSSYLELPNLHDDPDDHPVYLDIDPNRLPNVVAANSPSELRQILDQYLVINEEKMSKAERKSEIQHEAEHGEAAQKLGAETSMYGIEFYKSSDGEDLVWQLVHFPRKLHTTKIGLAVLHTYPQAPSRYAEGPCVRHVGATTWNHSSRR